MNDHDPYSRPFVLVVDDEPLRQEGYTDSLRTNGVDAESLHPLQVTEDDLHRADLVAIDEYLDWTNTHEWTGTSLPSEPALRPLDGLALAAVFRSHAVSNAKGSRTAFAIRTGRLAEMGEGLPRAVREPLLAAQHDLDWVFPKENVPKEPESQQRLASLASACQSLPAHWPGVGEDRSARWLGLDHSAEWHDRAARQVEECRPPEHALANYTRGGAYLRWFLQRILPFPTFLLSSLRASVRLGLPLDVFSSVVSSQSPLDRRLASCKYTGALHDFTSPRWWRAGLDDLIEELLPDGPYEPAALAKALSSLHGEPLEPLQNLEPVVAIDTDYYDQPNPIEFGYAVRLNPDFWPVYADEPWAHKDDVASNETLKSLAVSIQRRELFSSNDERENT